MKKQEFNYKKYLKSKKWDIIRKKVLKRDKYTCRDCGKGNRILDVHHITYENLGHEKLSDLKSLCRKCHNIEHNITNAVPNKYIAIFIAVIVFIIVVIAVNYGG